MRYIDPEPTPDYPFTVFDRRTGDVLDRCVDRATASTYRHEHYPVVILPTWR